MTVVGVAMRMVHVAIVVAVFGVVIVGVVVHSVRLVYFTRVAWFALAGTVKAHSQGSSYKTR